MNPVRDRTDAGSVTPLIIGMTLCLLILGAGITAAGSAFLGGRQLQHLCDGAATTAAGTLTDQPGSEQDTVDSIAAYLATRGGRVATSIVLAPPTLTLTCSTDTPITFGALFGSPTLHRTTTATAQATRRTR